MNASRAIHPYRQEPFAFGADGILDRLAAGIPGAAAGVTLLCSTQA